MEKFTPRTEKKDNASITKKIKDYIKENIHKSSRYITATIAGSILVASVDAKNLPKGFEKSKEISGTTRSVGASVDNRLADLTTIKYMGGIGEKEGEKGKEGEKEKGGDAKALETKVEKTDGKMEIKIANYFETDKADISQENIKEITKTIHKYLESINLNNIKDLWGNTNSTTP